MHLFIEVVIRGPISLLSTGRFISLYLPISSPASPYCIVMFYKSHSPDWSHIGQSSGWFANRNSMTPCCAVLVLVEALCIFILGATIVEQAGIGLFMPSTSTRHILQFPETLRLS